MSTVIIGGGQAGIQTADSLRSAGYEKPITIIADEQAVPYQRPPLSKDLLLGAETPGPLPLRPENFFESNNIKLLQGKAATRIDRRDECVVISTGAQVPYDSLVLATGTRNRQLSVPGAELPGIHGLRTLADAETLAREIDEGLHVVIVGGGFIGLECATALLKRGCQVTALEFGPRPMGRALSPKMSHWFTEAHRSLGTNLRLDEGIVRFEAGADGRVAKAVSTIESYSADLVIVGIGVEPNDSLAADAGLKIDNGIVVDEHLRTSDPDIYAIGDCANFPSVHSSGTLRLESVQNATAQARHASAVITGSDDPYQELPWFWSVQGPYKLQIAGLVAETDEQVVAGDPILGRFSILSFRNGKLAAVESVNTPGDHMAARHLLSSAAPPTRDSAEQMGFSLRALRQSALAPTG